MADEGAHQLQSLLEAYWVGQKLGAGARSEIYEVKRKTDGQVFACKFVQVRDRESLRAVGHLENEWRVLTKLHAQPGEATSIIVRPVEFKKLRRLFRVWCAYLVMEHVRGESLFANRAYPIRDVLLIFRQVCIALEHMHKAGYVHADLKPQQILVGDGLKVKLIDFGFAAPIGTTLSSYKGTFGYLAPEQAAGRLTEKTDVFNLGAALYWVLTGQNLPSIMPGEHQGTGFVPDAQINIAPPCQLNPEVPKELSDMVLKCCSASEHERPTVRHLKQYMHGLQLRIEYGLLDRP